MLVSCFHWTDSTVLYTAWKNLCLNRIREAVGIASLRSFSSVVPGCATAASRWLEANVALIFIFRNRTERCNWHTNTASDFLICISALIVWHAFSLLPGVEWFVHLYSRFCVRNTCSLEAQQFDNLLSRFHHMNFFLYKLWFIVICMVQY